MNPGKQNEMVGPSAQKSGLRNIPNVIVVACFFEGKEC